MKMPAALLASAAAVLAEHAPAHTWVNIGATAPGIGALYPLARQMGFGTLGIVSSLARSRRSRCRRRSTRCSTSPTASGAAAGTARPA